MEILRDGCYFGIEGKEVPLENVKQKQTTILILVIRKLQGGENV